MSKSSVGRFMTVALFLACAGGTGFAVAQVLQMRSELGHLSRQVTALDRRAATPTASTAATPVATPAVLPTASPDAASAAQIEALRRQIDELAQRTGGPASGGASPSVVPAVASGEGGVLAAALKQDGGKEALKKAIEETLDERDKKEQQQRAARGMERMLDRLAQELTLNDSQKQLLKPILEAMSRKFADLMGQDSMSRDERRAAMDAIRKETDTQITQLLTAEQAQQYQQLAGQVTRGGGFGWMGGGRGGGGNRGGGPAPGGTNGGSSGGGQPQGR